MTDTHTNTHTDTNSPMTIFDWQDVSITKWKKVLRIVLRHGWKDVKLRGYTAQESASMILSLHDKELDEMEREFLKGLLV